MILLTAPSVLPICPQSTQAPRVTADAQGRSLVGKIVAMVLFSLSCFGLLLFLWISFGGPIPLQRRATAS